MAKMDIKQAYRNIPVHPQDRLGGGGGGGGGQVYLDATLLFGLRSVPLIFTVEADTLQWIMEQRGGLNLAHYIDDFITLGAPGCRSVDETKGLCMRRAMRQASHMSQKRMRARQQPSLSQGWNWIRWLWSCGYHRRSWLA